MTFIEPFDLVEVALAVGLVVSMYLSVFLVNREDKQAHVLSAIKAPLTNEVLDQLSRTTTRMDMTAVSHLVESAVERDRQSYDNIFYHHLRAGTTGVSSTMRGFLGKRDVSLDVPTDIADGAEWR